LGFADLLKYFVYNVDKQMVTGNRSEYLMALEVTKKATLILQTGNLILNN